MARTSRIPDLEGREHDEAVSAIVSWFHDNYADPADMPVESSPEFTRLYVAGRTYDPREIIGQTFSKFGSDAIVDEAIAAIEQRGNFGWFQRNLDPDEVPRDEDVEPPTLPEIIQTSAWGNADWDLAKWADDAISRLPRPDKSAGDDKGIAVVGAKYGDGWESPQIRSRSAPPDLNSVSAADAPDVIKDWFFANFEDPAHRTPYESAEGGYQYIWGGPYDALDVISGELWNTIEATYGPDRAQEIIETAVELIQEDGLYEWVPAGHRIVSEEEYEADQDNSRSKFLHWQMLQRIADLEKTVSKLPAPPAPGIGHNYPPEPIEVQPISAEDRRVLAEDVATIKSIPVEPPAPPAIAADVASRMLALAAKIARNALGYTAEQIDNFVTEATKAAGKSVGTWAGPLIVATTIWGDLFNKVVSAYDAIRALLAGFGL